MLTDAEYFKTRIGGLDGAGDVGDYVVNVVKGKSIPKSKAPVEKDKAAANEKSSSEIIPPEVTGEDLEKDETNIEGVKGDAKKESAGEEELEK